MKEDIYILLGKHYHSETTEAEEKLVSDFREQHPEEYQALKSFFHGKKAEIHDFDSAKAWQKVMMDYKKTSGVKVIPLFSKALRVAAAVAVLITCWFVFEDLSNTPNVEMLTANGSQIDSVILFDGSIVWLNENAELSYPSQFADLRKVELKGEAFFNVTRDEKRPFIIEMSDASVSVLGTTFNIRQDQSETLVSVATGLVEVVEKSSKQKALLKAGYSALVSEKTLTAFATIDPNFNSWNTGTFVFSNTPVEKVVDDLNTYYAQKITFTGNSDCQVIGHFEKIPLPDILQILKLTCDLSIEKTSSGYLLKSK